MSHRRNLVGIGGKVTDAIEANVEHLVAKCSGLVPEISIAVTFGDVLRNQIHFSVQDVPGMRFLVFDFAAQDLVPAAKSTRVGAERAA
eukprot:2971394-Rhodomonas_salina.6